MSNLNKHILEDIQNDDKLEQGFPGLGDALKRAPVGPTPPSGAPPPRAPDNRDGQPPGFRDPDDRDGQPPSLGDPNAPEVDSPEDFMRKVLLSLKDQPEFEKSREELSDDLRDKLDQFMDGKRLKKIVGTDAGNFQIPPSQASRRHFEHLEAGMPEESQKKLEVPDGKPVFLSAAVDAKFDNWGRTVSNTPKDTYIPTTVAQVQAIVKNAKAQGKRVRASGYRHTWSNMYSQTDHILISMLNLGLVNNLPNPESIWETPDYRDNEFKTIELAVNPDDPNKALVRLGAAVTNEDFRRWATNLNQWTVALNVIMVEITIGGSNAPICHGAGMNSQTLSDLVRQIEYVDANGEKQVISDPALLRAASGCFGLLGIVTHITLEVDKMTYAVFNPAREELILAIPPPDGYIFPKGCEELQKRRAKYSPAQLAAARERFIEAAEKNYYAEWFWFPYQEQAFVNVWNNTPDPAGWVKFPSNAATFLQWSSSFAGEVMNNSKLFRWLKPQTQAGIMGTMAMATLPHDGVKTQLIEALHFRRGIQNMRVGDFEVEIPIPETTLGSKKRDWNLVQRAWWDGICAVYQDVDNVSARIALEMRVTADSKVILAPQMGNTLGTASIEVITNMPAVEDPKNIWTQFKQTLANIWTGYTGPDGQKLNVRPHWAKEWEGTKVGGLEWVDHMKKVSYPGEIANFKSVLGGIGAKQGWTLEDLKARFSTPLLDNLIFD